MHITTFLSNHMKGTLHLLQIFEQVFRLFLLRRLLNIQDFDFHSSCTKLNFNNISDFNLDRSLRNTTIN